MNTQRHCVDPGCGALLAGYELDLLDEAERRRFEAHLSICPACLDALYEMAPSSAAILDDPAELAAPLTAACALEPSFQAKIRSLFTRTSPRVLWPAATALAALLAFFLVVQPWAPKGVQDLARIEALAYVPIETRSGGTEEATRRFAEGMDAYAAGRYGEAARLLGEAATLGRESESWRHLDQARLYLGVCHLLAGEAESAVAALSEAVASPLPVLSDRARWYLAQTRLLQDDPEKARALLKELAAGSPGYGAAARAQLDALSRRLNPDPGPPGSP